MNQNFQFKITSEVINFFPKAKVGGLLITNLKLKTSKSISVINAEKNLLEDLNKQRNYYERKKGSYSWLEIFESMNLPKREFLPSHLSLMKRVLKNNNLFHINQVVDMYNIVSLHNLIPVGGHDIENIPEIQISRAKGGEVFQEINNDNEEEALKNEFIYHDAYNKRVLTRNLVWRQSDYSKITEKTKNFLVPIDDIPGIKTEDELFTIAQELISLLSTQYHFGYEFAIISKFNNSHIFSSPITKYDTKTFSLLLDRGEVNIDHKKIESFFDRKIEKIFPSSKDFKKVLSSGKRLTFYIGADSSGPKLHIGHLISILKMAELQKLGHQIIFLIGDFTARIGDPSDKNAVRKKLSETEVTDNAKKYKDQISKYINFNSSTNPAKLVFNSQWNSKLTLSDVIELASNFTVQQMLERDMFSNRLKNNKPIHLHEFLYPLIQGYDSVHMEVDGEFGGTDQTFNMMAGRHLEKNLKGINKFVITTKLLLSSDATSKMSKSVGNCIFLLDSPDDKFGKIMAIPDSLIIHYYELATNFSDLDISQIKKRLNEGENPINIKKELAEEIIQLLHNTETAQEAKSHFEKTIQRKEVPENIPQIKRDDVFKKVKNKDQIVLKKLIHLLGLTESTSEAKRLIKSGAVDIDNETVNDPEKVMDIKNINIVRAGKRNWIKLI